MLTQKLLSRTVALAMTASVALLSGCPTAGVTPDPNASTSPSGSVAPTTMPTDGASVSPSASTSVAPTASGASVAPTASGSSTASATPSATGTTTPTDPTGTTPDIRERATFNGKVYDRNGVPVDGATVTAKSVESGVTFTGESQQSVNGAYVFRNAPVGTRLEVTVTKAGWTSRTQSIVLKSNLNGDPNSNVLNFGTDGTTTNGNSTGSIIYAIQDEPEITSLKINDRVVGSAFQGDRIDSSNTFSNSSGSSALLGRTPTNLGIGNNTLPGNGTSSSANGSTNVGLLDDVLDPSLTGVASNTLKVELTFSEPVNKEDVEQNFRIRSQNYSSRTRRPDNTTGSVNTGNIKNFTISRDTSTNGDLTYTWSADDTMLTITGNRAILTNSDSEQDEFRYLVDFQNAFEDKSNRKARSSSYFRFSPSQVNEFAIFSTADDDTDPRLVGLSASNGSTEDVITLQFNEDMSVINQTAPSAILDDSISTNGGTGLSSLRVNSTNNTSDQNQNIGVPNTQVSGTPTQGNQGGFSNNATLFYYDDFSTSSNSSSTAVAAPRYSYMIGKLFSRDINNITTSTNTNTNNLTLNDGNGNPTGNQNTVFTSQQTYINNLRVYPLGTTLNGNGQVNSSGPVADAGLFDDNTTQQGNTNAAVREVRVNGKVVTLSLDPTAFQSGDRIIASVGNRISGQFIYQSNGNRSLDVNEGTVMATPVSGGTSQQVTAVSFRDPAGNIISRNNSGTINNVTSNDSQRTATAN